jgi:hypothetical protein
LTLTGPSFALPPLFEVLLSPAHAAVCWIARGGLAVLAAQEAGVHLCADCDRGRRQ